MHIHFNRVFCFLFLMLGLFSVASQVRKETAAARFGHTGEATRARLDEAYGKLPLAFEVNRGQAPGDVRFLSAHSNCLIQLSPGAVTMRLRGAESKTSAQVRIGFVGANPAPRIEGSDELITKSNYLTGADPRAWQTNIPNYARVRYHELWPGVDAVFYSNEQRLEYDLVVAPGADPRAAKLAIEGAEKLRVDASGDLILQLPGGELRQQKPVICQQINGEKRLVEGRYVVRGNLVGFEIGRYDRGRELMIDPVLNYAARTFAGNSIAADAQGNAYITAVINREFHYAEGRTDMLISKLNAAGTQLVYNTVVGGKDEETPAGIAVDAAGNVYVTGTTSSTDFPGIVSGPPAGIGGGGCFKSNDGGVNWDLSGRGLPSNITPRSAVDLSLNTLIIDPTNSSVVYGGFNPRNTDFPPDTCFKSVDGGKNWTPIRLGGTRLLAVVPSNPSVIYVDTNSGPQRSMDGGATWSRTIGVGGIKSMVYARNDVSVLYAAAGNMVIKTTDSWNRWTQADKGLPDRTIPYRIELKTDPNSSDTVYAIISELPTSQIYRSTDGAANWQLLTERFSNMNVLSLAVDPTNSSILYVGTNRGLFKSSDGGANWQHSGLPDLAVSVIEINPANPAVIYASTPNQTAPSRPGVYKSTDAGMNWNTFDNRLNGIRVFALTIDLVNPSTLYAGADRYTEAFALKLSPTGASLVYATYLGPGAGNAIALGSAGDAYIAGSTYNLDFVSYAPPTKNGFLTETGRGFLARLNAQGTNVTYLTQLPGAGNGVAVDGTGKAYVAGTTGPSLPVKNGFQTSPGVAGISNDVDAYVVKIDTEKAGEDSLLYSTYLGGNKNDSGRAVAVDSRGQVYVTGNTSSDNFPVTASSLRSGKSEIYLARIDPARSGPESLVWSSYLGDGMASGLTVDSAGNVYVTGATKSLAFPITPGSLQPNYAGGSCESTLVCPPPIPLTCILTCNSGAPKPGCPDPVLSPVPNSCTDAFVSKVNATGTTLSYSTYLGANGSSEEGKGIAVDAASNVYVTGSGNVPPTAGAFQNTEATGFIAKLTLEARSAAVASLSAASFLGPQLAPESLAVGFLDAFGAGAEKLKVTVRDSAGTERDAAVLFSGFGQVNFQMPPGTADGDATVKVTSGGAAIATGAVQIARVAPGVFAANANGRGVAAAVVQRVSAGGSQAFEMLARYDQSLKQWVSIPIDLGPESDQVYIALFGTGWRFRSSESAVRVTIGGVEVPLLYAGLQPTLTGVDQINVQLPRSVAGKGEVDVVVTVDGKIANAALVNIK